MTQIDNFAAPIFVEIKREKLTVPNPMECELVVPNAIVWTSWIREALANTRILAASSCLVKYSDQCRSPQKHPSMGSENFRSPDERSSSLRSPFESVLIRELLGCSMVRPRPPTPIPVDVVADLVKEKSLDKEQA